MTVIARCPGMTASGRCHRRPAHHGHCATGGSYANALDERDDARQQLDGAVSTIEQARSEFAAALKADEGAEFLRNLMRDFIEATNAARGGQ